MEPRPDPRAPGSGAPGLVQAGQPWAHREGPAQSWIRKKIHKNLERCGRSKSPPRDFSRTDQNRNLAQSPIVEQGNCRARNVTTPPLRQHRRYGSIIFGFFFADFGTSPSSTGLLANSFPTFFAMKTVFHRWGRSSARGRISSFAWPCLKDSEEQGPTLCVRSQNLHFVTGFDPSGLLPHSGRISKICVSRPGLPAGTP